MAGAVGAESPRDSSQGEVQPSEIVLPPRTLEEALQRIDALERRLERYQDIEKTAQFFGELLVEYAVEDVENREKAGLDDKTGLYRPVTFENMVQEITAHDRRAEDKNRMHGLILADIDHFGDLNKLLMHGVNDKKVLIPATDIIKSEIRDGSLAGRFGGDEFAIFLRDTDLISTFGIASRIQTGINAIKLPAEVGGRDYVGICMGIVRFRQGADYAKAFYDAGRLLYKAKAGNRNQIVTEDMGWSDTEA